MKEIATIKLAPGNVAFYDEYTKIHLTLNNPYAKIYEGMNLKRIKASVKYGTLRVVVGSLVTDTVTEVPVKTIHDPVEQNHQTTTPDIKIQNIDIKPAEKEHAETTAESIIDEVKPNGTAPVEETVSDTSESANEPIDEKTEANQESKPDQETPKTKRGRKKTTAAQTENTDNIEE